MKKIITLLMSAVLASSALAGTPSSYSAKGGKTVQPMAPVGCECFAPGFAYGIFGGVLFPSGDDDNTGGGGILGEFFFTENFGIQGSYGLFATSSEHHQFDASLVLRAPIKSLCIAPYVMVGGGLGTNGETRGDFHAGAGIEARFEKLNCMGLFVDAAYHFTSDEDTDFTLGRLGIKFPL